MPNLKRPPRVQMRERQGRRCDVSTCDKLVHGLSRFCSRHHGLSLRYGGPTQERVLRKTTKPYDRIASRLITANKDHPAIVMVIEELDELVAAAARARAGNPFTPGREDWRGPGRRVLQRARAGRNRTR